MERAKKMVLISTENLERMQQLQQQHRQTPLVAPENEPLQRSAENDGETVRTPGTVLSRLDADMYRILNSTTNGTEREKWKLYREVLQRYLYFFREKEKRTTRSREEEEKEEKENEDTIDERTRAAEQKDGGGNEEEDEDIPPLETPAATRNEEEAVAIGRVPSRARHRRLGERKSVRGVLCEVPKSYRARARKLLIHLCDVAVPDRISWDREGAVTIDGRLLNGARIVELVNDAVRRRKTARAVGRAQFARLLREVSTPLEFVGNPDFRHSSARGTKRSIAETSLAKEHERVADDRRALYLASDASGRRTRVSGDDTGKSTSKRRLIARAPPASAVADRASSSSASAEEEEFFTGLRKKFPRSSSTPIPPGNVRIPKRSLGDTSLAGERENSEERAVFISANKNKQRTRVSGSVSKSARKRRLIDWEQMA